MAKITVKEVKHIPKSERINRHEKTYTTDMFVNGQPVRGKDVKDHMKGVIWHNGEMKK